MCGAGWSTTLATFSVEIVDDGAVEDPETLGLWLSSPPKDGMPEIERSAALNIVDNERPGLVVAPLFGSKASGNGLLSIRATSVPGEDELMVWGRFSQLNGQPASCLARIAAMARDR